MEIVTLSKEQLDALVRGAVREELRQLLQDIRKPVAETHLLCRKDAAKFLGVSLQGLHKWTRNGLVIAHRVGSKVYYKKNELEQSLKRIHTKQQ